jgi:hypothetical protein
VDRAGDAVTRRGRRLRRALPFVVSAAILAFLLARVDARAVAGELQPRAIVVLALAVLAYGALSLGLEALSLTRVSGAARARLGLGTCARLKAASYPLSLLHYGLGAAAVTLLLHRRARLPISSAAGMVLLLSSLDLGVLLALGTTGALLLGAPGPALRAGVVGGTVLVIIGGFVLLRAPFALGPFERLRSLAVFDALRQASARLLAELACLRLLFVLAFVGLGAVALAAFDVRVPPGDLVVGVAVVALVAALPIALSGLGTGQAAFVVLFRPWADPERLLACSLALSAGLIAMRAALGLLFAREFAREALDATREGAA